MAAQGCRQLEHTHDVRPDAGELRVGGEFGGEGGVGRVERLGGVCGYGVFAGGVVGDGGLV